MRSRLGAVALAIAMASIIAIPSAGAAPSVTQVVHEQTANGWFSLNEGPTGSVGTSDLVVGPGALPSGTGSVKLTVDGTGRASIGTNQFKGTRLDQLTGLSYSVFVPNAAGNGYPVLQFDVDYDLNDANTAYQGRLSYNLGAVANNTWVNVNAFPGTFFRSNVAASPLLACGGACTIAQVLAQYPNAGIRNVGGSGALLLRLGGPVTGGATVYADALQVNTTALNTLVDFEPGAVLTPNQGPSGTVVTATAYGFKPNKKVSFRYHGYAKPKWTVLCKVKVPVNSTTATCTFTVPTGTAGGNIGIHPIEIKGKAVNGQSLKYLPDFFRTP
jgi:hypothetical protein